MQVETIPISQDNYAYLVICERAGVAAAVDPADPDPVLERARAIGVPVVAVWTTHHHYDHAGGNLAIAASRDDVRILGGGRSIPGITDLIGDGARFELGKIEGRAIHVPGHTMDSLVFCVEDAAFTGDTLFGGGCGRPFEGDPPMLYRALNQSLARLPPATRIFFGHEYTRKNLRFAATVEPGNRALQERINGLRSGIPTTPSTWGLELETNPFLRCDQPEIQRSVDKRDPVSVFTVLRARRSSLPDAPSDLDP